MHDNILVLQVTYYHCVYMCKDANLFWVSVVCDKCRLTGEQGKTLL